MYMLLLNTLNISSDFNMSNIQFPLIKLRIYIKVNLDQQKINCLIGEDKMIFFVF